MRYWVLFIFLLMQSLCIVFSQTILWGKVYDDDSTKVLPFVYVINKNSSFGTVSDINGRFDLKVNSEDTLIFSYVGYVKQILSVKEVQRRGGKIIMKKNIYQLKTVDVKVLKYENYEKDYMKRVIEKSQIPVVDVISSPITALYMQFSKKGREQQKLAKIFEDIFIQEQIQKKINSQVLYQLTGDANVDVEALRKFCGFYMSDYYILNHDGYELYSRVLECYYRYKYEKEH